MILSIVLSCIILIKAYEHDAPDIKHNEIALMQLLEFYSASHGVVHTLPDEAFSATDYHLHHVPSHVRIGSENYWEGKPGGTHAITVDLTSVFLVTGMATEGMSSKHYVTQYSIMTSKDGLHWTSHGNFVGNFDGKTMCKVQFDRPIFARFVKLTVVKYELCPCMRLDVLVYDDDYYYYWLTSENPSV